jgi:Tfp pilus assembly protein PilF
MRVQVLIALSTSHFGKKHADVIRREWPDAINEFGSILVCAGEDEPVVRGVLASDPDLAEAYSTLGQTLDSQWQREEAGRAYRRATELNPNYATGRHWYGMHLAELGRMDEALAEVKAACDLDPFSFIILDNYGWLLTLAGRYREALQMLDRAAALNPGFDQTTRVKAAALAALGRNAEAEALARQLRNSQREQDVWTLGLVGLHDEAKTLLQRMEPRDVTNRFQALLAAGQREAALAALADPSGASKGDSIDTLFQPIYDPVRADPRFIQYLATLGLSEAHAHAQAWRKAHPPEKPEAGKQ